MKPQRFVEGGEELRRYHADECTDTLDGHRSHLRCLGF
jgi:hypothetical protein